MPGPTRRDAVANREKLIATAFDILAERDADVTVRELAVSAGLGIGTAYRHFPHHTDLIHALYDESLARLMAAAAAVPSLPTAWERIALLLENVTFAVADMPALRTIMRRLYDLDPSHDPSRSMAEVLNALIAQAQAEGSMRAGVSGSDLALIPFALGGLVGKPTAREGAMLRRSLDIYLDGLRASAATHDLPTQPMNAEQFRQLVHRSNGPARA